MILTLEQLRERLAFWQRVLRLQDWDITVIIVRRVELKYSSSAVGEASTGCYRHATIRLADPIDFTPNDHPRFRDMEDTLVHELVHLHLNDCAVPVSKADESMSAAEVALERAIDAIAGGLVALTRRAA